MKTHRKFPLFILWVLVCGCPKQAATDDPLPAGTEVGEPNPEADLETACYEGDPEACDALGH